MSDFLDSILARNFAAHEALPHVQPRPAARFETPDGALFTADPTSTPEAPSARPAVTNRGQSTDVDHFLTTQPPLRPLDSPADTPLARREALPTQASTPPPLFSVEPDMSLPEIGERRADERRPVEMAEPQAPISTETDFLEQRRPMIEPAPIVIRVDSILPAADVQTSDLRFPTEAETVSDKQTPSLVRVTIGRIEVITPQPPPPIRPAAPRAMPAPVRPVSALDDYLRRRNEGRR